MSIKQSDIEEWLSAGCILSYKPGYVLLGWGKLSWHANPNKDNTIWFYFPDYFLIKSQPWVFFEKNAVVSTAELVTMIKKITLENTLKSSKPIKWKKPAKSLFKKGFDELQSLFKAGILEKVVLYVFSESKERITSWHRKHALEGILNYIEKAHSFAYGFWGESEGILGATPELLFRLQDSAVLETMALAGTQRTDAYSHQMLNDEKLLHEHRIVVENIKKRVATLGKVEVGKLQVLTFPVLSHLYTPISVQLSHDEEFASLVKVLHPTPALGGFPRDAAWKWLRNYNQILPRDLFGAPIGFWDRRTNQKVCYVGIRNVMWDEQSTRIGAGCGLVLESLFDKEWEEVLFKTESIMRFLQL